MNRLEAKPLLSLNQVVDYSCHEEICFGAEPGPVTGGGCLGRTIFLWGLPAAWTTIDWLSISSCDGDSSLNGVVKGLGVVGILHSLLNLTYACFLKYKPHKAGPGNWGYERLETYRSSDSDFKHEFTRKQLKAEKCCLDTTICFGVFTLALNIVGMTAALVVCSE